MRQKKSTDADKSYYGPAVVPPTTTTPEGIKTGEGVSGSFHNKNIFPMKLKSVGWHKKQMFHSESA